MIQYLTCTAITAVDFDKVDIRTGYIIKLK